MNYKGYTAIVEVDEDDGVLHGRLAGIREVITFESETIEGLVREFQTSVDLYLDWCAERGKTPSAPHVERRRAAS